MLRRNITKQLWDWKSIDHDYEKRGKENGRSGRKEQYGLVSINSTNKNERSLQS